jgi:hypothetical protein
MEPAPRDTESLAYPLDKIMPFRPAH